MFDLVEVVLVFEIFYPYIFIFKSWHGYEKSFSSEVSEFEFFLRRIRITLNLRFVSIISIFSRRKKYFCAWLLT